MTMKYQLDTLEGVDEAVSALYEPDGDKFKLKIEGLPPQEDVSGLKAKLAEVLAEKKEEARRRKDLEEKAERERVEALAHSGDVEAIRKDAEARLAKAKADSETELGGYRTMVQDLTVNATAMSAASDLAVPGSAEVLLPHIRNRLKLDMVDGKPVVRVLAADGSASTATVDDLKKEISGNRAFAPLIAASLASGAGGHTSNGGGAAKKLEDMNGTERAAMQKTDPVGFDKLVESAKQR